MRTWRIPLVLNCHLPCIFLHFMNLFLLFPDKTIESLAAFLPLYPRQAPIVMPSQPSHPYLFACDLTHVTSLLPKTLSSDLVIEMLLLLQINPQLNHQVSWVINSSGEAYFLFIFSLCMRIFHPLCSTRQGKYFYFGATFSSFA